MHTTSRSVVAAARAHPAGVAAPSAVIATAIVLLTLVTWVIVPAIPPGLFGPGSAPVTRPSPHQPRYRIDQQQPVLTGPPIIPGLPSSLGRSAPCSAGQPQPVASPLPPRVAGSPPGSGPVPGVGQQLPPGPAGGCPACHARQSPVSAVTTVVAGAGNVLPGVTRVLTSGAAVPAATGVVAAASGTAVKAVGALASTVAPAAPVVLGGTRSALIQTGQATAATVTTTVTGAGKALQGTTRTLTSDSAVPSTAPASQAPVSMAGGGSGEDSVEQALPGTGTLPVVGKQ